MATGIEKRGNAYRAWVWSARDQKRIRQTFPTLAAAKAWRADATSALGRGELRAPAPTTVREAAEVWLVGARDGRITNRSGDRYKPSAIRTYDQGLRLRVLPELGGKRLSDLRRIDLQDFADRMVAKGADPSTIQSTLMPVRAICRRALARGEIAVNPTTGLELPAIRGQRDRIVSPEVAARMIEALPRSERALWATALYAGLRRGELMALGWEHVDLAGGVIRVERSWDVKEGYIEPKGAVGRRKVPIPSPLRDRLVEHRMAGTSTEGLVFGRTADRPFDPHRVVRRARTAWKQAAATPQGKAGLATGCKQALEQAKTSMGSYGCSW